MSVFKAGLFNVEGPDLQIMRPDETFLGRQPASLTEGLEGLEHLALVGVSQAQDIMERQVLHMVRLVDDLLDVSRAEIGERGLHEAHVLRNFEIEHPHQRMVGAVLEHILEGSVRKLADEVRVNVQLIDARTDSYVWVDTYERKLTDVVAVESEIARGIVDYSCQEIEKILGCKSCDIEKLLGYRYGDEIIHRDNLVML